MSKPKLPHHPPYRSVLLLAAAILGTALSAVAATSAQAAPTAPTAPAAPAAPAAMVRPGTREPGPALSPARSQLQAALHCPRTSGTGTPVLLVHGTSATPDIAWSKGLEPLLLDAGYRVCTVALPAGASGPIDVAGEYVTDTIRTMAARYHHSVSVVGHSQGGMLTRWAITWWPDIRSLVDDVIGISPSNHGSSAVSALCVTVCPAAYWQQAPSSRFLSALNRVDETPGRVDYSVVYSTTDTTVPPPSPVLRTDRRDTNTAVQGLCRGRRVGHTQMLYDAVSLALVFDALTHDGPARPSRIPRALCDRRYAAGIDADAADQQQHEGDAYAVTNFLQGPDLAAEPGLPHYATRPKPHPRARLVVGRHTDRRGRTLLSAVGVSGTQRWPLPFAQVIVAGRRTSTDAAGRVRLRIPRGTSAVRLRLQARGLPPVVRRIPPRGNPRPANATVTPPVRDASAEAFAQRPRTWHASWATAQDGVGPQLRRQTIRTMAHLSQGGPVVRVRFANQVSTAPVALAQVVVGRRVARNGVQAGSARTVTFAGRASFTLRPGQRVVSDPVRLSVRAQRDLVVDSVVAGVATPSAHGAAFDTNYLSRAGSGNRAGELSGSSFTQTTQSYLLLTGVDVLGPDVTGTVAVVGGSVVDGQGSRKTGTMGLGPAAPRNSRWSDVLARRLLAARPVSRQVSVVNAGISSNTVARRCATSQAPTANVQDRYDRDVLAQPGLTHVIIYAGTNDIGFPTCTAKDIISAYQDLIRRSHRRGVDIVFATITPRVSYTPLQNQRRSVVNRWLLRHGDCSGHCDGVVDFDTAIAWRVDPDAIDPALDSGDTIHPNAEGYHRMADVIPLGLLR